MRITLLWLGKTAETFLVTAIEKYTNRLSHYCNFEVRLINDVKNAKNCTTEQLKDKEGKLIISQLKPDDFVVLLDEHGKEFSSVEFAKFIDKQAVNSTKNVVFVIGGAYGFSDEVYKQTNVMLKISLSKMTFSHQLVRLIFVEQLYRAFTILKGEPYHHE